MQLLRQGRRQQRDADTGEDDLPVAQQPRADHREKLACGVWSGTSAHSNNSLSALGGGEGRGEVGDSSAVAATSPSHCCAIGPSLCPQQGVERLATVLVVINASPAPP